MGLTAAHVDMPAFSFTVPGPPTPKARARVVYRERAGAYAAFTPEKTRVAEDEVGYVARSQGVELCEGPVRLTVRAFLPIPGSWSRRRKTSAVEGILRPTTKPDLDNIVKMVSDALNHIAFNDDSQIVESHVEKWYSTEPRTEVTIEQVE
jgi:Holliday junction resolvase RusA-like endonuclease